MESPVNPGRFNHHFCSQFDFRNQQCYAHPFRAKRSQAPTAAASALSAAEPAFGLEVNLPGQLEIRTERILSKFAELTLHKKADLYRIWLVSPWITYKKESRDPLVSVINAASTNDPPIVLITRQPKQKEHLAAVRLLESHSSTTTYVLPSLHSKVYLLQCNGFRAAFFGSPNFTVGANKQNQEIAIDLRSTTDDSSERVTALINTLASYVSDLRTEAQLFES